MDFVADGLIGGRHLRCLTIIDDCTRECLAIEVDTSITGVRVKAVLERPADMRELSDSITVGNGPESDGQVLDKWAYRRNVTLSFIRPERPNENAYIESFRRKFRDECLDGHWFSSLAHACSVIEAWRIEYNTEQPHRSLGTQTGRAARGTTRTPAMPNQGGVVADRPTRVSIRVNGLLRPPPNRSRTQRPALCNFSDVAAIAPLVRVVTGC